MANDYNNDELDQFNNLAKQFGMEFKKELKNPVTGNQYDMGKIMVPANHPIFQKWPAVVSERNQYLKYTSAR